MGSYKWYQSIPVPIQYGSRTNQGEAGGHVTLRLKRAGVDVTPEAEDGDKWSPDLTSE